MNIHVNEIIPGRDTLGKDVVSSRGVLLLKAGTKLTKEYKKLLQKQVKTVYVA